MQFDLTIADLRRFWSYVNFHSENGCWEWDGQMTSDKGQGHQVPQFHLNSTTKSPQKVGARRISHFIHLGCAPMSNIAMSCGNPKCISPRHMVLDCDENEVVKRVYTKTTRDWKRTDPALVKQVVTLRKLGWSQPKIAKKVGIGQTRVVTILQMAKLCKEGKLGRSNTRQQETVQ